MSQWSIRKLSAKIPETGGKVEYSADIDASTINLNELLGQKLRLSFAGEIHCISCQRKIKKSFNQGFCFPCFQSLAACDMCIVRPERCHFDAGTCREPEWGQANCMIPHTVYLAVSSGLKVGVTRRHQRLTRWVDQGASRALAVLQTSRRLDAGRIEVKLKSIFADKTNWRRMLKNEVAEVDLLAARKALLAELDNEIPYEVEEPQPIEIEFPVLSYPEKVTSLSFDKTPEIAGTLLGIKGQYFIFDTGVVNIRKHQGYQIGFSAK